MKEIIESICGKLPANFKPVEINSNPNFIFSPDSNFTPRSVTDYEGNAVTVNSFTECYHYVSNGWDYSPILNNEYSLQNTFFLTFIFIGLSAFYFFVFKKKVS